jgi:hypothetical protein
MQTHSETKSRCHRLQYLNATPDDELALNFVMPSFASTGEHTSIIDESGTEAKDEDEDLNAGGTFAVLATRSQFWQSGSLLRSTRQSYSTLQGLGLT